MNKEIKRNVIQCAKKRAMINMLDAVLCDEEADRLFIAKAPPEELAKLVGLTIEYRLRYKRELSAVEVLSNKLPTLLICLPSATNSLPSGTMTDDIEPLNPRRLTDV